MFISGQVEKALTDASWAGAEAADQHSDAYASVVCRIVSPAGVGGKMA
jgi:hypothetical protein